MSTSLSSLVNNLSDNLSNGQYNNKCKNCTSCDEYISAKDNQSMLSKMQ